MSRKLIAGFRALLDDVCTTAGDAAVHAYIEDDKDEWALALRSHARAKRRLDRAILDVLLAARLATTHERQGHAQPQALHCLAMSLQALEGHARMQGRKFVAGHSERTQQARKAAA